MVLFKKLSFLNYLFIALKIEKLSQEIEEPWPEKDLDTTPQKSSVYLSPKSSSKVSLHLSEIV